MRARTLLFAAVLGCAPTYNTALAEPSGAFEQLAALAGEWQAELGAYGKLRNSIRLHFVRR